jgi:membrane associated rhomboid family serine protease
MRRYPSPYASSISFGPGPVTPAIKVLIGVNALLFLAQHVIEGMTTALGLIPQQVLPGMHVWQLATYMFLHEPGSILHILFNMLTLWMFGTELERMWGTRYFLKYYFVTGIGAAVLTVLFSLLPLAAAADLRHSVVIGASGAIYGVLLAYAMYFPERPILLLLMFPIPAKYFVMIIGFIAFYTSLGAMSGVASATHLGGLVVGYLYLKGARVHPVAEVKYRYLKWKINRTRRKFDVYSGGRADDWDRRVH